MKGPGRRGFQTDFKTRVFIRFFVLITAASCAFTFVFIQHEKKALSATLIKNGLALADLFAHNSRLGAFSENPYFLKDPIEGLTMREEVTSVFVFTADGRLLNSRRGTDEINAKEREKTMALLRESLYPTYSERADLFEFWAPILSGAAEPSGDSLFYGTESLNQKDRVIGFVRIDISKDFLGKSFKSLLVRSLLIAAIFLAVGTAIAYFMAKNVTRPLNSLTEGVQAIEKGLSAPPVPFQTNDEIGRLAMAFNAMAEALRERETQLRSLASKLSLVEEGERRRIATDLHDNLGQTLAVSKMKLETLREFASTADAVKAVDRLGEFIDEAISYTRSLTSELSPPVLHSFGFVAAVEWLVEQFREQHGILFKFSDDGELKPLNEETQILLFRVTRELMINIIKHSHARSAKVSINKDRNIMRVVIEDDGVGFDASTVFNRVDRFGLFSVRERLKYLGGHLEVESGPGSGTRVILSTPLNLPD